MYFYLTNIIFFLLYSAILHLSKKDKYIWWLSLIQFGLISMFRGTNVGSDTWAYCKSYMNIGRVKSILLAFQSQLGGFSFILWPLRQIMPYPWMWMIISGLVPTACIWIFIKLNSPNQFLSIYFYLTCYFYFEAMNAGRQSIAIGFALIALSLIYRGYYLRSLLFTLIALLVHSGGAIIILLAYPVFLVHWTPRRYLLTVVGSILAGTTFITLQNIFVRFFSYYENYSYISWQSHGRTFWFYLLIAMFVVYGTVILTQKSKGRSSLRGFMPYTECLDNSGTQIVWGNAVLITFQLALCMVLNRMIFVIRATMLCTWLYILFIPQVLSYKTRIKNLVKLFVMFGTFGYMFLRLMGNYGNVWPYSTFLE